MNETKSSETADVKQTITVAGVTFSADDVISAVVKLDGRKVHICEQDVTPPTIGFSTK